jgi:hypothetical protein
MTQLWFNAWSKKETNPATGITRLRVSMEGDACESYDDAMQDLDDYGCSWRRQGWSYFGTHCHEIDVKGQTLSISFHDDLESNLERWKHEREEDARAYRAAGTLSAEQLCNVGRAA